METTPTPAFIVAETDFLFQFEIIALNPPAQFRLIDHAFERNLSRQCGKPIVIRFGFTLRPLDQQPFFSRRLAPSGVVMGRADPPTRKPRTQRRVAAVSPRDRLPGVGVELQSQCLG